MQTDEQTLSLRMATIQALQLGGTQLLKQPSHFLGAVLDFVDPTASTTRVMERNCDKELLKHFVAAAQARTPEAIDEAANKAMLLLREERMINERDASKTACEIAFALANYLGVDCSERVRMVATGADAANASVEHAQAAAQTAAQAGGNAQGAVASSVTSASGVASASSTQGGAQGGTQAVMTGQQVTMPTQAAGSAGGAIDPATLSNDSTTRRKQIENAGIGMKWYIWLLVSCWASALASVALVVLTFNGMPLPVIFSLRGTTAFMLWGQAICYIILAILSIVTWGRLSKFKRSGPATLIVMQVISAVLPLFLRTVRILAANGNLSMMSFLSTQDVAVLFTGLFMAGVNYVYLSKRKQFFTL